MRTLDLTPMMSAMRDRPGDFIFESPWLRHRPSGHSFLIVGGVLARIETPCSCGELRPNQSQTDEFARVFNSWMSIYWQPLQAYRAAERRAAEINRQFTSHFCRPTRLMRLRMRLADAWRAAGRELTRPDPAPLTIDVLVDRPQGALEGSETSSPRHQETVGA
jgi:hypothetical protein